MKLTQAEFESIVERAAEEARSLLRANGLNDDVSAFRIKIKEFSGKRRTNWVALYRPGTAFISGKAIFWVNSELQDLVIEQLDPRSTEDLKTEIYHNLIDTFLHEAAHAICDVMRFKCRYLKLDDQIASSLIGDEEEFAERMIETFKGYGFEGTKFFGLYQRALS